MTLFPFYVDIEDKNFLIVGGGSVAKEKLDKIRQFTDRIKVVAKETDIRSIPVEVRAFAESDLDDCDVCIVATSDRSLNARIARLCNEKNIPVNVVDDRQLCTFIFPSFVKRGPLCLSVTTGGKSPLYARTLRQQVEEIIPYNIEEILQRMDALRSYVPERVKLQKNRKALYGKILARLIESQNELTDSEIEKEISKAQEAEEGITD